MTDISNYPYIFCRDAKPDNDKYLTREQYETILADTATGLNLSIVDGETFNLIKGYIKENTRYIDPDKVMDGKIEADLYDVFLSLKRSGKLADKFPNTNFDYTYEEWKEDKKEKVVEFRRIKKTEYIENARLMVERFSK